MAADDGVQCLSLPATKPGLGSVHLLQLTFHVDLTHLLPPFELPGVLLLFDSSPDVGADVLYMVRRRKLHEPVPIHAHLAECILLSPHRERVLLQLPPINAFFHLRAVTGLLGANVLARLFLVRVHALLERILVVVYALQCACDVLIDCELAVDLRVRLSPIGRPDGHSDPLLALSTHHATDSVRLPKPIAIARDDRRGLLSDETCFRALILGHLGQILLSFSLIFFCPLFFLVSPLLFWRWLPKPWAGRHLAATAL